MHAMAKINVSTYYENIISITGHYDYLKICRTYLICALEINVYSVIN